MSDENINILKPLSASRKKWIIFSNLCTWMIPDCLLWKNRDLRQAWREKLSIVMVIFIMSCFFLFVAAFLPQLLCQEPTIYTWENIYKSKLELMVVGGKVLDVGQYANRHPCPIHKFIKYLGQDVSYMFNLEHLEQSTSSPSNLLFYPELQNVWIERRKNDTDNYCNTYFCHTIYPMNTTIFDGLQIGNLTLTYQQLKSSEDPNWVVIYNQVYNVSEYVRYGHGVYPNKYDYVTVRRDMAYYFDERLNTTIMNRLGQDATQLFEESFDINSRPEAIDFLNKFYYAGQIDTRFSPMCLAMNYMYFAIVSIMASIMGIKFLTALMTLYKQYPKCKAEYVVVNIPCYTESLESMKKTIYSIYDSEYDDSKKLLFIVIDGIIKSKTTAADTLKIFNRTLDEDCVFTYEYESMGDDNKFLNKVKIFHGWHESNKHRLPYIIIVKVGNNSEVNDDRRGNRGKRDSQLILLKWLNRLHLQTDTDFELSDAITAIMINSLNIDPLQYKFVLSIDADTYAKPDAIQQMVFRMKDPRIIALCGETLISNKLDSWVTAIQVYEYYLNHNLNKAFESLFSAVTCLPGCFSLYRILSVDGRNKPLIIDSNLLAEYSDTTVDTLHKKNLLDLGEDRFFTTLLSKYFPTWKIKFTDAAQCETTVPSSWKVLVSQRRRWINSTLHNLFELMFHNRLCGCCCFSMKFVVIIDIITTMILPITTCYFIYLIYAFATQLQTIESIFLVGLITTIGTQMLIFVIKRDLIYIVWYLLYLLSFPVWHIILPLYAFWHMDDFKWGATQE